MGWTDLVNSTTLEYLTAKGISEKWAKEMVDSTTRQLRTRVYCQLTGTSFFDSFHSQDVDGIHALEGVCSLIANSSLSVSNGNFHISSSVLVPVSI